MSQRLEKYKNTSRCAFAVEVLQIRRSSKIGVHSFFIFHCYIKHLFRMKMLQFGSSTAKHLLINGTPKFFEQRLHPKCECCILKWKKFSNARNSSSNKHICLFNGKNANASSLIFHSLSSQTQPNSCKQTKFFVQKRSKRLLSKENNDFNEALSVNQPIPNSKTLETLWKLYRNPGESVEEVKQRLVDINDVQFVDPEVDSQNYGMCIKKENYEEMLNRTNDIFNDPEEISREKLEGENACVSENSFYLGDILSVEIIESNESVQLSNDQESFNIKEKCKKNEVFNEPSLYSCCSDSFKSSLNCTYDVPRIQPMKNAEQTNTFFSSKANKNSVILKTEINKEMFDPVERQVVVREMYDTQIINYEMHTPEKIIPKNLRITKLSDLDKDEELEFTYRKTAENLINNEMCPVSKNHYNKKRKRLNYEYDDFRYSTFQLSSDSGEDANFLEESSLNDHIREKKHSKYFLPENIDELKQDIDSISNSVNKSI